MSGLGEWLFQQERDTINRVMGSKMARTGTVQSVVSGRITVTDPLTGGAETELLSVLGALPLVGERVAIIPLSDGSRIASALGVPQQRVGVQQIDVDVVNARRLDFRAGLLAAADGADEADITPDPSVLLHTSPPYGSIGGASMQAGRALYLSTICPVGALSGVTLVANRLYYCPIWVGKGFTGAGYIFEVTTAVSGSVQCGVYDCTSSFLPDARLSMSTKTAVSTTGMKTFGSGAHSPISGRWYWVGICSTVAMALKGSTTAANLPSLRGGSNQDGVTVTLMAGEDLTAGWATLPANATPGSQNNTYLHVGMLS